MPNKGNKILKYNHGAKSLKAPFMIYDDLECLFEKMHSCQNNLEKSYIEKKKTEHAPSGYSRFKNCSFDATKNKLDCYRGEDCMNSFCKGLRDHTVKIIKYEEKEMILLTDKKIRLMKSKIYVIYANKNLVLMKMTKMHLNYNINSEIIVIILEYLEELVIVFAIQDTKHQKKFQ